MSKPMTNEVSVTQSDFAAAEAIYEACDGTFLTSEVAEIIARHRTASEQSRTAQCSGDTQEAIDRCQRVLRGNLLAGLHPDAERQRDADISILETMKGGSPWSVTAAPTFDRRKLMERAFELVHHEDGCPSIGGNGDGDCKCDAVPFLRELEVFLTALRTTHSPSEAEGDFPLARAAKAKVTRQTHEEAKVLLGAMLNWSDSQFVHAVAGEDGEILKARIEGVIGNLLDHSIAALSLPSDKTVELLREQIINTPETADFMKGVPIEAAHQRERWGVEHDAGKAPLDWFWLIGYLAQKAATSAIAGDTEKALHHTISTAAALANWHAALSGKDNQMRPGLDDSHLGEMK